MPLDNLILLRDLGGRLPPKSWEKLTDPCTTSKHCEHGPDFHAIIRLSAAMPEKPDVVYFLLLFGRAASLSPEWFDSLMRATGADPYEPEFNENATALREYLRPE